MKPADTSKESREAFYKGRTLNGDTASIQVGVCQVCATDGSEYHAYVNRYPIGTTFRCKRCSHTFGEAEELHQVSNTRATFDIVCAIVALFAGVVIYCIIILAGKCIAVLFKKVK